ncbi:MAG: TetR family transcriptional regulator [Candidatus Sulfotelmatobacter sp.]
MTRRKEAVAAAKIPRRSDATRARILEAAREAFATLGYERATVRTIAGMAKIHPSMVMRYYATKEGLFTASSQFDLHLPDLSSVPPDDVGECIVRTFLDRWENRGVAGDMPALLRLSVTHPEGRDKAIAVFTQQVKPALARVIRSRDPARSAALIATQLVGVAFLRYVLRLPPVVALRNEDLVVHVGRTIQRYIDGDAAPPKRPAKVRSGV